MTVWLRQSTATTLLLGPYLDSTDGVTPETALAPTVRVAREGGAWGARSDATAIAHTENGYYSVVLNATDTGTLGRLDLASVVAGAAPVWDRALVLPAQVWDSLLGTDRLQVHAAEISPALITATTFAANAINDAAVAADVTIASVTGAVGSVTGAVGSVTAPVTAGTVTDKSGYALSAAGAQAIWDRLTSALTTVGSVGKLLVDRLDATVGSRLAGTSYTAPPTAAQIRAEIDASSTKLDVAVGTRLAGASYTAPDNAGVGAIRGSTDALATMLEPDGAGYRYTAGALSRAPSGAAGAGALSYTYTVYRPDGSTPVSGAEVWVSTDPAGSNVVAGTLSTDAFGRVTFLLDPGTYYVWRQHEAYTFPNPDVEVVS